MSRETHLCDSCLSIFSKLTNLPTDLGPKEYISSGPNGKSGRQWQDKTSGNCWTDVCGMFHERWWSAKDVSKAALIRSAAEGCYICVSIWRRYSTFTNTGIRYRPDVEKISYEISEDGESSFSLKITVIGAQESCVGLLCGKPRTCFPFRGVLSNSLPPKSVQSDVAPTTRSQQTMTQAKTWINDCKEYHMKCQRQEDSYDLPTRLVRVDYAEDGDDREIFASLCRGSTLPPGTQYLTLSHLWGKHEFLKLMKNNVCQWENSIPTNQLSPSFQDALYMTRSLGFKFIWIDSLCIIQDDLQDWEQESEAMCRIYKGAVCNIAASARQTSDGHGFLPSSRYLEPVVPPLVHIDWHASPVIQSRNVCGRDFVISEAFPQRNLRTDELYDRAWVLQEEMLALRTLHCQGDQIYWECRTSICNEVWPSGWATSLGRYRESEGTIAPFLLTTDDIEASQAGLAYTVWLEMVSSYSRRAISYGTDRLPALAGIAADTAFLLNDTYASGIWQKALHNGVLYQSRGTLQSCEEPPQPLPLWDKVPSWSWASLDRPVVFVTTRHPPETEGLCDIEVLPAMLGQLSVLEMTGPLMRLDWIKTSPDAVECQAMWKPAWDDPVFHRIGRYGGEATWEVHVQEDHWFAQKCYSESCAHPIPKKDYGEPSEKPYFAALFDNIFFMPVLYEGEREYKVVRSFAQYGGRPRIIGLLLWAEPGQMRGTYRRVGTAQLALRRKEGNAFCTFKEKVSMYQAGIREVDSCRSDGNGRYTVRVV
ncbi:HET-domain-containing protein [Paraphaeosphaeria sporulosa]|uniref:HET-domain-containing protein n=1 Tax=Paraphaeosphaeria sporulosa TaxID=1460663 RepID=A0A177CJ73_9PLEO|nr:HET-domain-containing protein [Paraphaeosphaeria sporulosa]OAG07311.1 HET-domain-containing protein [Paraphaeosphaeria sporulosa]